PVGVGRLRQIARTQRRIPLKASCRQHQALMDMNGALAAMAFDNGPDNLSSVADDLDKCRFPADIDPPPVDGQLQPPDQRVAAGEISRTLRSEPLTYIGIITPERPRHGADPAGLTRHKHRGVYGVPHETAEKHVRRMR